LLVERSVAMQYSFQELGSDTARRQARCRGRRGRAGHRHARPPRGRDEAAGDINARVWKAAIVLDEIMGETEEINAPSAPARRSGGAPPDRLVPNLPQLALTIPIAAECAAKIPAIN